MSDIDWLVSINKTITWINKYESKKTIHNYSYTYPGNNLN